MINDLFINILLLTSITFVIGHISKDISMEIINSLYGKVIVGVGGGLMGILLMTYTIQVEGTSTLLDLRVFAIMLVSYIGGIMPTIIAGIMIGIYRGVYYGINMSSIVAVFQILLYIIFFHIIDKLIIAEWKKWFFKTLISLIILLTFFCYLLRNLENIQTVLFRFSFIAIVASVLEYCLLDYVKNSNKLYKNYKKDATKDYLTGLYNTRQFDKILKQTYERVFHNKEELSYLMLDIDDFKIVNDTYGHSKGDIILKELAHILEMNCRASDIIGRIGGEEFCVLLSNCPKDQAFETALRINNAVQEHEFAIDKDKFINITVSIGVANYPDTTSKLEDIKEKADIALYKAKKSGRNRVCISEI